MKTTYAPDIHFYESNTGEAIIGHEAINTLISKLQTAWTETFEFTLNKPSQVNYTTQIISWNLGPQGAPPVATGVDVAITENDFIQTLYLFLDI